MKVFRNYTVRSLLKSRTRTVVTLIGIILSMSLFTAVIEAVYSARCYMIDVEEEIAGPWNGAVFLPVGFAGSDAFADERVKRTSTLQFGGSMSVDADGEEVEIMLGQMSDQSFPEMAAVSLSTGRLPENDREVLLPQYSTYGLMPGDTVQAGSKTYTVTGIMSGICPTINRILRGSPFGLTGPGGGLLQELGPKIVFFELKDPGKYNAFTEDYADRFDAIFPNVDLLTFYGAIPDRNVMDIFRGVAAVLVFLIVLGSVSLIYNSFAISVTERTKQYGILKSIGATKKQIGFCVFYEAFLLCLIGIPLGLLVGCTGIGLTFYFLKDAFASMYWEETQAQMRLVLNAQPLLLSAGICLATTIVSAVIPSVRAVRISPLEAIRQTKDIRLSGKKLRVNPLTGKIFGFSGVLAAKSMKRNRRQYRAISVSLFFSIVLFVGASYFCDSLEGTMSGMNAMNMNADITCSVELSDQAELDRLKADIAAVRGVSGVQYASVSKLGVYFPETALDASFLRVLDDFAERGSSYNVPGARAQEGDSGFSPDESRVICNEVTVSFVDDGTFRGILRAEGLSEEAFFDAENPAGIARNHVVLIDYDWDERKTNWYPFDALKAGSLPAEGFVTGTLELEGYADMGPYTDPDGVTWEGYVPYDDVEKFWGEDGEPDWSVAKLVSMDEAAVRQTFRIAALTEEEVCMLPTQQFEILYPFSLRESVLNPEYSGSGLRSTQDRTTFGLMAEDYAAAEREINGMLSDRGLGFLVQNNAADTNQIRMLILIVRVFSFGFIILIALIAAANVFNTISTGIMLRRREFAMLKSIGLSDRGVLKILNCECLICGLRALLAGLPVSVLVCFVLYRAAFSQIVMSFVIPWKSMAVAAGSVFIVIFASMLYAAQKLKKDNVIDAVKREV